MVRLREISLKYAKWTENQWNHNRKLAAILLFAAIGAALWASFNPQSPGVCIGLLALVAGVMSVRPEMHIYEKMLWVVVLIVFAILEVLAIGRSDKTNEAARDLQNKQFAEIAIGLEASITASKTQSDITIKHVDGVLATTQQVGGLAKQSLEYLNGDNSFAVVVPAVDLPPQPPTGGMIYTRDTPFSMYVGNAGKAPLTGVSVAISHVDFVGFGK
jgi:hypothetical protein